MEGMMFNWVCDRLGDLAAEALGPLMLLVSDLCGSCYKLEGPLKGG